MKNVKYQGPVQEGYDLKHFRKTGEYRLKKISILSILILTLLLMICNSFATSIKVNIDAQNYLTTTNVYHYNKYEQFVGHTISLLDFFNDTFYIITKVDTNLKDSILSDINLVGGHSVDWCKIENIFATNGLIGDNVVIYEYNETSQELTMIAKTNSNPTLLDESIDVSWNSDCSRLAVAGKDTETIVVYDWNTQTNTLTQLDYITDATRMNSLRTVFWNTEDDRLITVSLLSNNVATFIWNETTDTISYETQYVDNTYLDYAYEGDICGNKIVASSRGNNPSIVVLNYNKDAHTLSYSTRSTGNGLYYPLDVKFNNNCDRIAVAEYNNNAGIIYTLNGATLIKQLTYSTHMSGAHCVAWSEDNRYIGFALYTGNGVTIMDYDYDAGTWTEDYYYNANLNQARGIDFSNDGAYMSAVNYASGGNSNVLLFQLYNKTEVVQ